MNSTRINVVLAFLVALFSCAASLPATAATRTGFGPGSNPILFVHGWQGGAWNWDAMVGRFKADGWPPEYLDQWSYDSGQSNATTAEQLAQEVERLKATTGASKVDIVTHSMGGLSARYYTKNLQGDASVDGWVSLAGPNHGTTSADACPQASCTEMRIGSEFLNQLNAGDETPGAARYATWRSPCDEVIYPHDSTKLAGAANTETACLGHVAMLGDDTVYSQVRDHVN